MMLRIPGLTDVGWTSEHYAEFVDLFPTITEASIGVVLDKCPKDSSRVETCTEGKSLVPYALVGKDESTAFDPVVKDVVLGATTQYSRCSGDFKCYEGKDKAKAMGFSYRISPCRSRTCTMGYTMSATLNNKKYRYTEWVAFNTEKFPLAPDFESPPSHGEIYDHDTDSMENVNLWDVPETSTAPVGVPASVRKLLADHLHACSSKGCNDPVSAVESVKSIPSYAEAVCTADAGKMKPTGGTTPTPTSTTTTIPTTATKATAVMTTATTATTAGGGGGGGSSSEASTPTVTTPENGGGGGVETTTPIATVATTSQLQPGGGDDGSVNSTRTTTIAAGAAGGGGSGGDDGGVTTTTPTSDAGGGGGGGGADTSPAPEATTTTPAENASAAKSGISIPLIAGAGGGGLLVLIAIAVFCKRKCKNRGPQVYSVQSNDIVFNMGFEHEPDEDL